MEKYFQRLPKFQNQTVANSNKRVDVQEHGQQGFSDSLLTEENTQTAVTAEAGDNLNTSNTDSDVILSSPKKKRSQYIQKYSKLGELEPELKGWLKPFENPAYLACCKVCGVFLKASSGKTDLRKHSSTSAHIKNSNAVQVQPAANTSFALTSPKKQTIKAELQIAAFIVEHNLSFLVSDHLVKTIKNAYANSNTAKSVSCNRSKITALVKNVIGAQQLDELSEIMRDNFFSICIDESTDVSATKILSTVVRVCINFKIYDFCFALSKVTDADAKTLHLTIVNNFIDKNINYKKYLIGFAADGANNMTGNKNSVASLLKGDCPNLVVLKCICHSFALCASYACLKLPPVIETMCRDIYNYIQNSPKRVAKYQDILKLLEYKPYKLLHPSQTRWLS